MTPDPLYQDSLNVIRKADQLSLFPILLLFKGHKNSQYSMSEALIRQLPKHLFNVKC